MAKKLRQFDREQYHRGSWLLAGSLACPVCCARLRGNKVFAWCEAWHCHFWCYWEEINEVVHKFNLEHPSTYLKECYACLQDAKGNHT